MIKLKRVLALMLAVLMLASVALGTLSSCEKKEDGENDGGNEDGSSGGNSSENNTGNNGNEEGDKPEVISYKLNVTTEGGMAMSSLPVYLYSLKDGELFDLVDYGSTDESGNVTFNITGSVTDYAVKVDSGLPKGYNAKSHYPLVGTSLNIEVGSKPIENESLSGKSLKLGDIMYDFTVVNTDGKQVKLSDELKNHDVVILNFWYVDCSACQLEFPFMKTVSEEDAYKDSVSVIALNPIDDDLSIRSYASDMGFEFNVAKDTAGIAQAFGVEYYPTTVVIDRYGMVSLVEVGALPNARGFRVMFDHFIGDNYVQEKVESLEAITPVIEPNVPMPDVSDVSNAFDGGALTDPDGRFNGAYYMDSNEKMAWPFVIDEKDGEKFLKASNSGLEATFSQLFIEIDLQAGDVVAFDYYSSTETGADILYVLVDGKDIYSISGQSEDWDTCFAYVADKSGTYEIAFCYIKDGDDSGISDEEKEKWQDNVFLKNLRVLTEDKIDSPSYIYRYASNNPNDVGVYTDYVEVFLGDDGYYHVGSKTGPLLLADLMGRTHFSENYDIYSLSINMAIEDELVRFCNYASNSQIYGLCPVTKELKALLDVVVDAHYSGGIPTENTWLDICCYYDSYGTDEELGDPIKGLAYFSAFETILSDKGDKDFPNKITYDRVIMPRGLLYAFTPSVSGVYQITSKSEYESNGWIFRKENLDSRTEWLVYDKVDRLIYDTTNVYMIAYFEKGETYYIDIAFYDVYQFGDIEFRVERLGDAGIYRFSLASPGYFTYYENTSSSTVNKIISGGIEVELGEDGIWREKRTDGRDGSILYADFTNVTPIFNRSLLELIDAKAFDFGMTENDHYVLNLKTSSNAYKFYFDLYLKDLWGDQYESNMEKYKVNEVLKGIYHGETVDNKATPSEDDEYILGLYESVKADPDYNNDTKFKEFLKYYWTDEFYTEYLESYKVDEVLSGVYHGNGQDYSEIVKNIYLENKIDNGTGDGKEMNGCVIVNEQLAQILQLLMDKYTFYGVENSWAKVCYYHEYFGPSEE